MWPWAAGGSVWRESRRCDTGRCRGRRTHSPVSSDQRSDEEQLLTRDYDSKQWPTSRCERKQCIKPFLLPILYVALFSLCVSRWSICIYIYFSFWVVTVSSVFIYVTREESRVRLSQFFCSVFRGVMPKFYCPWSCEREVDSSVKRWRHDENY